MLPFPKRKASEKEIELGDEDLVVLHEDAIELDAESDDVEIVAEAPSRLPAPASPPARPSRLGLRNRITGVDAEDDVADECLASIAAATSRSRLSDRFPPSIVPPPPRLPRFDDLDVDNLLATAADADATTRLPPVTVPPFRRPSIARDSVPGVVPSSPGSTPQSAFARSSPFVPVGSSSIAPVASSISPPPSSTAAEPTVILVHQPPKSGWIIASAISGAAAALAAMFLLMPARHAPEASTPASVAAAPAPSPFLAPAPPLAVVAPQETATAATPAVVRFDEAQAVAVTAPAPAPVAPPKVVVAKPAAPAAPAAKPIVAAKSAPAPSTSAPALEPDPPAPKRKLTPAQELAEAQLKASMK